MNLSSIKLALKVLARRKFFTFISLFGISMTLVVLILAVALLDNVLLPRAPETRLDRALLADHFAMTGPHSIDNGNPGYYFLDRWVRTLPNVDKVAVYHEQATTPIYMAGRRIEAALKRTDGVYWQVLDFRFLEGGPYRQSDDDSGRFVLVITDALRDKLFGGGRAVGKIIDVAGQHYAIVGVVPAVPFTRAAAAADMWAPIGTLPSSDYRTQLFGGFHAIVLAHSRADFPRLRREMASRLHQIPFDPKEYDTVHAPLDTPFESLARTMVSARHIDSSPAIFSTMIIVIALVFMGLPALNLITLNLSRILERAPEIGVRKAFGAPPRSLVSQFVFENVVLTVIGGTIAFILATIAVAIFNAIEIVPAARLDVSIRVFAWGMLISAFFGIFSGVYPAWKMSRLHPVNALRGGSL